MLLNTISSCHSFKTLQNTIDGRLADFHGAACPGVLRTAAALEVDGGRGSRECGCAVDRRTGT